MKTHEITMKDNKTLEVWSEELWGVHLSDYALKRGYLDYRTMFEALTEGRHILANTLFEELIKAGHEMETINGSDWTANGDPIEVFQYYMIDGNAAASFQEYTDEIVYYDETADVYFLGVTHFGTSWSYVLTDYELHEIA